MKFYVTTESVAKLKKSFLNLKLFYVICVPDILENLGYTYSTIDSYGIFIISNKINDAIKTYSKSKRIRGIIYSNPTLNMEIINNLYDELEGNEYISNIVLFDNYDVPKLRPLYEYFDEILFFPSIRKIRICEVSQIPGKEEYEEEIKLEDED